MNGLLSRCLIQKHSQGSLECIKEVYLNLEEYQWQFDLHSGGKSNLVTPCVPQCWLPLFVYHPLP